MAGSVVSISGAICGALATRQASEPAVRPMAITSAIKTVCIVRCIASPHGCGLNEIVLLGNTEPCFEHHIKVVPDDRPGADGLTWRPRAAVAMARTSSPRSCSTPVLILGPAARAPL